MISRFISLTILIVLLPFLLLVSILIALDDGFPIFFSQKRTGINNKIFWIYKFRTMKINTPNIASHLINSNKNYNTSFGKIIRKLSIDEIPQLINIFKGEMRFIGPRPALYNQYDLIDLRTKLGIHKIHPGITGWAQINGRDDLSISKKVSYDEYYLINRSTMLNIKIIFLTFLQILTPKGVSH